MLTPDVKLCPQLSLSKTSSGFHWSGTEPTCDLTLMKTNMEGRAATGLCVLITYAQETSCRVHWNRKFPNIRTEECFCNTYLVAGTVLNPLYINLL